MHRLVELIRREINPFMDPEGKTPLDYVVVMGLPAIVVVGLLVMFLSNAN